MFFQGLSTEIVEAIGDYAHPRDVRALGQTCQQLHSQLRQVAWSRVLIRGTDNDIMRKLQAVKPSTLEYRDTFKLIKKARIVVDGRNSYAADYQRLATGRYPDRALPSAIVDAIKAMTSLQSLTLNLEHLDRMTRRRLVYVELLGRISENQLKALQLSVRISSDDFTLIAQSFGRIERLCLCVEHREDSWPHSSMNSEVVMRIASAFPRLKRLIFYESKCHIPEYVEFLWSYSPAVTKQEVVQNTIELASALNTLPHLQQFACRLLSVGRPLLAEFIPSRSSHEDVDAIFGELACTIKGTHPKLDEIAIITPDSEFYLWKRGVTKRERREELHNPDSFPFGLG
ncbi:hypothetical protein ACHAPJ_011435 [Fusarium lateritium]